MDNTYNIDFIARCIAGHNKIDIAKLNENIDIIDAKLKEHSDALTEVDTALSGKQDALSVEQLSAVNSGITSESVAQIETNKNNISSITPTITTVDHTAIQTTNYEQVTGLTYTLAAGKTAIFNVSAINQRGAIRGIKIVTGTTLSDADTVAISETSANYRALTCGGIYTNTSSGDVTLYVFVKFYSAVKNAVTLSAYQV